MPFILVQAGTALQKMSSAGVLETLTLPTGVTIDATKRPRWAIFNQRIVLVNSPSQNLVIDPDGTVSPLNLTPPASAPILAAGNTGDLSLVTGRRVKVSFKVIDEFGVTLNESPLGPASNLSGAITSKMLAMSGVPISWQSTVNARGIYSTTDGGSVYFPWFDLEGNTLTSAEDDLSDALLQLVAAPTGLGLPQGALPGSYLRLITSWRERLFAVGSVDVDNVYHTDAGSNYTWKATNVLPISPVGEDEFGVTAFMRRRDELGIGKRDRICKITGDRSTNFQPMTVVEQTGVVSQESVVIIRDTAFFLGEEGVYTWDSSGVKCISNARVHPWFTTDNYFNRSRFYLAFARWNRTDGTYELHLAAAGTSVENRWVSYELATGRWLGPHLSDQIAPTCGGEVEDSNDIAYPAIGSSDFYLYLGNQTNCMDHLTAIPFSVTSKCYHGGKLSTHKVWLEAEFHHRIEGDVSTPTVSSYIGDLNAGTAVTHTLTTTSLSRTRTKRLSTATLPTGRFARLLFEYQTAGRRVLIYGFTLPFVEVGER